MPKRTSSSARWRKRWREGDRDARTELIVEVALELLRAHGAEGVTMRRVAGLLGVGAMTLYTYVPGQADLRLRMIQRGFVQLREYCDRNNLPNTTREHWQAGAKAYIQFATEHPRWYELMFSQPIEGGPQKAEAVAREFEPFYQEIRDLLSRRVKDEVQLDLRARATALRIWVNMHGLASLAISGRIRVLNVDLDTMLANLLEHVGLEELVTQSP